MLGLHGPALTPPLPPCQLVGIKGRPPHGVMQDWNFTVLNCTQELSPDWNSSRIWELFTESALWVDSVRESPCPYVCLRVCAVAKNPLPDVVETYGWRTHSCKTETLLYWTVLKSCLQIGIPQEFGSFLGPFYRVSPLGRFSQRVAMSICLSACLRRRKKPTSGCCGDLWLKNTFQILTCDDTLFQKKSMRFLPDCWKALLDQPTVDIGGVCKGRYVAVAVGCLHLNSTSTALKWHLNGTSTALPQHFQGTSTIIMLFWFFFYMLLLLLSK